MKQEKLEFEVQAIDHSRYECILEVPRINHRLFNTMLDKAKKGVSKKTGKAIGGNADFIPQFKVHSRFYMLLNTAIGSTMKDIMKQCDKDGFKILNYVVSEAEFIRKEKEWLCKIKVEGQYTEDG